MSGARRDASVTWHEVECGGYAADLPLWEALAERADGPILELGCGTGRVMSHLSRRGHDVRGLDRDPRLIADLPAAQEGDAREFDLGREFALVLAPMQLVQLLDGRAERLRCLRRVAAHLAPAGLAALAIVESMPAPVDAPPPLPDTREAEGWVYSSLPVEARAGDGAIRVRRLRQTVSPGGELAEELHEVALASLDADGLEREAAEAGLRPAGRRHVPATDEHVGSVVVLLEGSA
jgi:SAM-dependent methyltransferase